MDSETAVAHVHSNLDSSACPFASVARNTTATHGWCPKQKGDSRSPCPAINALANHGYIKRCGYGIKFFDLIFALREVYGLSYPLALIITAGGYQLLHHWNPFRPLDLWELRRHNRVEHNASIAHDDVHFEQQEASSKPDQDLVNKWLDSLQEKLRDGQSQDDQQECTVSVSDVAQRRVDREAQCGKIDAFHREIARGEMGIVLCAWSVKKLGLPSSHLSEPEKDGIPLTWLRDWLVHERLPAAWQERVKNRTVPTTGLWEEMGISASIQKAMKKMIPSQL